MKQILKDGAPILIIFALFILMLSWAAISTSDDDLSTDADQHTSHQTTTAEAIENYKTATYGEPSLQKCDWCGGVGKVGFAGASETQIKRTGMGLGNICTRCNGTGTIKTWKK